MEAISTPNMSMRDDAFVLYGEQTDVTYGRKLRNVFLFTAFMSAIQCGITVYSKYFGGFYEIGLSFMIAIGQDLTTWDALIFFPVITGVTVGILSLTMAIMSHLKTNKAIQFETDVSKLKRPLSKKPDSEFGATYRRAVYGIGVTALIVAIIQVISMVIALGLLDSFDKTVRQYGTTDFTNGSTSALLIGYELAIFNKCCFEKGWSTQGSIPQCSSGYAVGDDLGCTVPDTYALFNNQLCACSPVSDQEYSTFLNLIQTYDVCQVLETEATVAVGQSESVPGSTLNLNFFYDLDEVPVVGEPLNQEGCGVGLAKVFQYTFYLWLFKYVRPISVAFIAVSSIQLLVIIYGVYENYCYVKWEVITERLKQEEIERGALASPMQKLTGRLRGMSQEVFSLYSNRSGIKTEPV